MNDMIEVYDEEKLKDYLQKDNSVESLLEKKIKDLNEEKQKLSDKYNELSNLEESYRDKLTHDSSTDEIRKIADEIDKIKEEVSSLKENISSLEYDITKTTQTKTETEKTKEDYIANISKTIDEYEKKLDAINKAIEVCDNESLKEAFNEEKDKMNSELDELKTKREKELENAISDEENKDDIEPKKSEINEEISLDVSQDKEEEKKEEPSEETKVPTFDELIVSDLNIPTTEEKEEVKQPELDNILDSFNATTENNDPENKMDSVVLENSNNDDELSNMLNSLNVNEKLVSEPTPIETPVESTVLDDSFNINNSEPSLTDSVIAPDINIENAINNEQTNLENIVIDNSFVDASKISEIFESSKVMGAAYEWLDKNSNSEKVMN